MRVPLEHKVLNENDRIAATLRERLEGNGTFCLNLISSPGSGKTSLLERTLAGFDTGRRVAVLTGDLQTDNDARRLARYGFPVRQITTGGACHLDARMVERHLADWLPDDLEILFLKTWAIWFAPRATTWVRRRVRCCSASPKAKTSR